MLEMFSIGVPLLSLISSVWLSIRANKKANRANELAKEANKIAKNANELVKRSEFSEYYNYLHKINKHFSEIENYLIFDKDIKKASTSMKNMCDKLLKITENDQMFPFPIGTNEVFNEVYEECKKIDQCLNTLRSMITNFDENYNGTNNNDFLSYKVGNLSQKTQIEYEKEMKKVKYLLNRIHRSTVHLISE